MARKSKLDPYRALIGTVPDRDVGLLAGVSPDGVRMYRSRNGIPSYSDFLQKKRAAGARASLSRLKSWAEEDAAANGPLPSVVDQVRRANETQYAYRVTSVDGEVTGIVVGASVVEALTGLWFQVGRVELIGEVWRA